MRWLPLVLLLAACGTTEQKGGLRLTTYELGENLYVTWFGSKSAIEGSLSGAELAHAQTLVDAHLTEVCETPNVVDRSVESFGYKVTYTCK